MRISIIIPVLNEEANIPGLLSHLQDSGDAEILVVDGGSRDRSRDLVRERGVRLLLSPPGRGRQQNMGAGAATGDTLLFLHSDTRLPCDWMDHVGQTLARPGVAAGAFRFALDGRGPAYRFIEQGANLRARLLQYPWGDQALFLGKEMFRKAGGFPDQPLLEELVLLRRLKHYGRIAIADATAVTSARRWQQRGMVRTTLLNQLILAGFLCGVDPERLAALYGRVR
ncbi:MAG TPA: glycosyltransferase [Desulfobulbus sp.]|nr:glycosyltransferase [Desulfobulbus sp.]